MKKNICKCKSSGAKASSHNDKYNFFTHLSSSGNRIFVYFFVYLSMHLTPKTTHQICVIFPHNILSTYGSLLKDDLYLDCLSGIVLLFFSIIHRRNSKTIVVSHKVGSTHDLVLIKIMWIQICVKNPHYFGNIHR